MPPKKTFKELIEESDAELTAYEEEQAEAQERADRDNREFYTGAGIKKPRLQRRAKQKTSFTAEGYERLDELTERMSDILKQVFKHIEELGIPTTVEDLDVSLPEGVRIVGLLYPHKKVKCPTPDTECASKKYIDMRILLERDEVNTGISYVLKHQLEKHNVNSSLIELGPDENASFRDLIFVLLNDGPLVQKKKKAPSKKRPRKKRVR